MRLLVDTHALLWWFNDDRKLSRPARRAMAESTNILLVSAASAWEIATKVRLGKLTGAEDLVADFIGLLQRGNFDVLNITPDHAIRAGLLAGPHRDPFDRMLAAQAQAEGLPIVSNDLAFDAYGVRRIW
jgi:PIN domain nuclease of toxin-antitoxin system